MKRSEEQYMTAARRMSIAKHKLRPNINDYIENIFTDFTELHGDRLYGDDPAVCGGIARFDGMPVTVIGHLKGHTTKENIKTNFGMAHPEGYRKALRLMKQAEKFGRPVICFVDTPGAFCGTNAEERGQGEAIARNLYEMMALRVPIISIIAGEGGSGGALALAVADAVMMTSNAIYSVISPKGFASILWKEPARELEAAEIMKITAKDLLELKVIDRIIEEPPDGAHMNAEAVCGEMKRAISETLPGLLELPPDEMTLRRFNKYADMGVCSEQSL